MPSATYIALATFTANGTQTGVTFSNIPNTYKDLVIQGNVIGNTTNGVFSIAYNGDSSNMTGVRMYGTSSVAGSDQPTDGITSATIGTNVGSLIVQVLDYAATDKHKTSLIRSNDGGVITIAGVNRWASTNAITSIAITSNRTFQTGMTLSLYGIAG